MRPPPTRRLRTARIVALLAVLSVVPLALLTYWSVELATDAVRREVEARVSATASISARLVEREMASLSELVEAYAERPTLRKIAAEGANARYERSKIRLHLDGLQRGRPGIYTAFLADPQGRLVDIVPETPEIIGKDFSFRDWYQGVSRTRRPYISEAYQTQARGNPLVVASAAPVRDAKGRVSAILVAAYDLAHLRDLSDGIARAQGVRLKVTDQRGVLVAAPDQPLRPTLVSRKSDPRVAAALRRRSGITELETPDGRRLSAYAPVPTIGWTVTASVPANTALAAVAKLRSTVLAIGGVLALVLVAGLGFLARSLIARRRAEDALASQNERLQELDRLKDALVASVSHELRTPLSSIRGYTDLLLEREAGELTEEQERFLGVIDRNAERLLRVVGDLLFVARIDAAELEIERTEVDLAELARECVDAARPSADVKRITLHLDVEPLVPIQGDRSRLGQLFDNLISNAIKFTPEGGRVDVRVGRTAAAAVAEVADTGIGIPAEEQEKLFERFFRTKGATEHAIQGTGLGLSITKAIAEAHGGTISVASEEGLGTTFRVELPLSAHTYAHPSAQRLEVA